MSDSEVLIQCENVGKKFCRDLKKSLWYGVKDSATQFYGRRASSLASSSPRLVSKNSPSLRDGEFWANKEINFELKRGECLGLIGRNGAGKTTLLKMLSGLIKPDVGRIEMRGRVGAMIALGAGFNPVLTGRENVYVNGSILGLSKRQIADRIAEIIDFAELGDFIDAPVRTYSSGMNVRLGFAIAAILVRPDILLLDEILAVGDAAFRHRCYSRMNALMSTSAVILVSHSMDFVAQCCKEVGLLEHGNLTLYKDPLEGIVAYNDRNFLSNRASDDDSIREIYAPIVSADINVLTREIQFGGPMEFEAVIESISAVEDVVMSFVAVNVSQLPVMCWHSTRSQETFRIHRGKQSLRFKIDPLMLHDGTYKFTFNVARTGTVNHLIWFVRVGEFHVRSDCRPVGNIPYLPQLADLKVTLIRN